jgi:SAM-dependent methyltransferase
MSSYIGRHAALYDLFYAQKDYAAETAFVNECILKYHSGKPQRLLEMACGTGKHAYHLWQKGYKIVATDYSEDMLACAAENHRQWKTDVQFQLLDMRNPASFSDSFDVIICLFDSIGYLGTNEHILNLLKFVHGQLKDKGLFIVEYWNAGAFLRNYEQHRVKHFDTDTGKITRRSDTEIDYLNQLAHVHYTITENNGDPAAHTIKETQSNRYFLHQEMQLFFQQAGLQCVAAFAGYSSEQNITVNDWHTVAVAKKPK